jgi:hypothetical protein
VCVCHGVVMCVCVCVCVCACVCRCVRHPKDVFKNIFFFTSIFHVCGHVPVDTTEVLAPFLLTTLLGSIQVASFFFFVDACGAQSDTKSRSNQYPHTVPDVNPDS